MIAYGPADATDTRQSLALLKSRMIVPFWGWFTQTIPEKSPLNRCSGIRLTPSYCRTLIGCHR